MTPVWVWRRERAFVKSQLPTRLHEASVVLIRQARLGSACPLRRRRAPRGLRVPGRTPAPGASRARGPGRPRQRLAESDLYGVRDAACPISTG